MDQQVQASMTAAQLFEAALAKVESKSIREWATSEHNKPIWLKLAQGAVDKWNGKPDVDGFTAYIVVTAMG